MRKQMYQVMKSWLTAVNVIHQLCFQICERYNDYGGNGDSGSDSIISIKFKESQIIALDNFLDIMKKQFASIVRGTTTNKINISENEKQKYASKLTQVEHLMELIKSTAQDSGSNMLLS